MSELVFVVDWDHCLGAGSEGEVFCGRCLQTWEACAIKVSTLTDRDEAASQLRQELELCLHASGDGVVGLIGWNLEAPRPYLAFELAKAGSLADEMNGVRRAAWVYHPVRALQRAREVLAALAKVHDRGVVHRDVKPENLLRFGGAVKLTDFGTGLVVGRRGRPEVAFVGTRNYAAPEQRRGETVDERTDLYAVGCILHEMVHGALPGETAERYADALVLPELERLVDGLLAPDPYDRPASAGDAIRRIDGVIATYGRARQAWERLGLGPSPY